MNKEYIENLFKEYNNNYFKIPEIQQYIEIQDNYVAGKFNSVDLYNQIYTLEISNNLNESDGSKAILFNEFTHVYDSLQFLKYPFEDYKKLMYVYSEVHASEVEMDVYLKISNFHYEKYMQLQLRDLIESFILPDGPIVKGQLGFNERLLYYYIGYLVSLNNHNIKYEYKYDYINEDFQNLFMEITDYFIQNNTYNYDILLTYYDRLSKLVKDTLIKHQKKYKSSSLP